MRTFRFEIVDKTKEISRKVFKLKGAIVVVALAVAPSIPGDGMEVFCERTNLGGPVGPVATDPMQKDQKGSVTRLIHCDRRGADDAFEWDERTPGEIEKSATR